MFAKTTWKRAMGALSALLRSGRVAQVSGRVCYAGRPLPGGAILLLAGDGQSHHARIDSDGRFSIADVPSGKAHVSVCSLFEAAPVAPDRAPQSGVVYSRIPTRYADLSRSGLTVDVTNGSFIELNLR